MSNLARLVASNTAQLQGPLAGLVAEKRRSGERKRQAYADLGASLSEAGRSWKEYGSWRDAKVAEDEVRQVDDAYALGLSTGDPSKALVTLQAVRPTTAKAATLRATRLDAASRATMDRTKMRMDEAEGFLREQKYKEDVRQFGESNKIAQAELAVHQAREARDERESLAPKPPRPTENIDPLSPEGIAATEEKQRRLNALKPPAQPDDPDGLDQPIPDRVISLLAEKAGTKPELLKGMTFREWNALKSDPQRDILEQLQIIARQRDVAEHEPPKLKRARKALEKAEQELTDFRQRMATASVMADDDKMSAEATRLAGVVTGAQADVVDAEGDAPAQPAEFDWSKATDEQMREEAIRRKLVPPPR